MRILNIIMAGIDHSMAGIDLREKFSFTKSMQEVILHKLLASEGIQGGVLISTCNRTEIYLSLSVGRESDPFEALCKTAEIDGIPDAPYKIRKGSEVFKHLCRLACGLESQILGEDQIITQVKASLAFARHCNATDSYLEVLFRTAITAAKKIKTIVRFSKAENSVALKTMSVLKKIEAHPKRILVIGNGEVGRLTASTLVQHGFEVAMTLRHYKYSNNDVPQGVEGIDYSERYDRLNEFDAVVSATSSPHFTLEYQKLRHLQQLPCLMIDLAVPRDIDPEIGLHTSVKLFDIDTMASDVLEQSNQKQIQEAEFIIQEYHWNLVKWRRYKELVTQ